MEGPSDPLVSYSSCEGGARLELRSHIAYGEDPISIESRILEGADESEVREAIES